MCKAQIQAIYDEHDVPPNSDGEYRRFQVVAGHKRILRLLMQLMGLKAVIRRKLNHPSTYQTAVSDGRVAKNLLTAISQQMPRTKSG